MWGHSASWSGMECIACCLQCFVATSHQVEQKAHDDMKIRWAYRDIEGLGLKIQENQIKKKMENEMNIWVTQGYIAHVQASFRLTGCLLLRECFQDPRADRFLHLLQAQ